MFLSVRRLAWAGVLSAVLVLGVSGVAKATDWDPPGGGPGWDQPPGVSQDEVSTWVGRTFDGAVPVRQILGLGFQYEGRQVRHILAEMQSMYGWSEAELWVNGRPTGPRVQVGPRMQAIYFPLDSWNNTIGYRLDDVQIRLRGQVYLGQLTAALEPSGYNPYPPSPPNPPYPPYPPHGFTCVVQTPRGSYTGHGRNQGEALADARNQCIYVENNARVCNNAYTRCQSN